MGALDRLNAGGSTNGGQGIRLAYQLALENFVTGGVNRVILCTDGDFNVGVTGTDELVKIAEELEAIRSGGGRADERKSRMSRSREADSIID